MTHLKDLTGQEFGRLEVIGKSDQRTSDRKILWDCVCVCGNKHLVTSRNLLGGSVKSCGCYRKELNNRFKTLMSFNRSKTKFVEVRQLPKSSILVSSVPYLLLLGVNLYGYAMGANIKFSILTLVFATLLFPVFFIVDLRS